MISSAAWICIHGSELYISRKITGEMVMVPFYWNRQRRIQRNVDFLNYIFAQTMSVTMRNTDSSISV